MSQFCELTLSQQIEVTKSLQELLSLSNFEGVIRTCEKYLDGEASVSRVNRQIWYFRAIALDSMGRHPECVLIMKELVTKFPMRYDYRRSLMISCSNLAQMGVDKYCDLEFSDKLESIYLLCRDVHFAPWFLTNKHLDMLVEKGRTKEAIDIVRAYLSLVPYDEDYLRKGLEVSLKARDCAFLKEVLSSAQEGFSLHPYRHELLHIIDHFFQQKVVKV